MAKLIFRTLTAFAVLLFQAEIAQAQRAGSSNIAQGTAALSPRSEWKPSIGIMGGIANPEGNNDSAAEIGLDYSIQPAAPFGAGIEITRSEIESEDDGEDFERTLVLAKGLYHFGGTKPIIKDSYAGIGLGLGFLSSTTEAAVAPMVGFDIPLKTNVERHFISLGANAKYTFLGGDDPDALSVNGVVKYWY